MAIEWVEVTVENNSTHASDYVVNLESPSGTETNLIHNSGLSGDWMDLDGAGFRFSTAAMYDEESKGEWKVTFRDAYEDNIGTLKSINIKIYGH